MVVNGFYGSIHRPLPVIPIHGAYRRKVLGQFLPGATILQAIKNGIWNSIDVGVPGMAIGLGRWNQVLDQSLLPGRQIAGVPLLKCQSHSATLITKESALFYTLKTLFK